MSDDEGKSGAEEKPFHVDRAKTGRSSCKKCKLKIESSTLRLAKLATNPFGSGKVKMWHHVTCMFEVFKKQRATTARINSPDDIGNWENMETEDQEEILAFLTKESSAGASKVAVKQPAKTPVKKQKKLTENSISNKKITQNSPSSNKKITQNSPSSQKKETKDMNKQNESDKSHKDNSFREFRRLCADISNEASYTGKTALVKKLFTSGSDQTGFKGDLLMWCRLLLPGAVKRVYNLQSKQLVKLFSRILRTDHDEMLNDLDQGDVAETVRVFFEKSRHLKPSKKSLITLAEVDKFLYQLSEMTKEDEQMAHFEKVAKVCSSNDLKMIIRLVKHDLRINAGPKHILEAIHQDAYTAFQASRDISAILSRVSGQSSGSLDQMEITVALMTPIQPMLAEPCKAIEYAMKKCPNGMYSEIKYDGERVQVHKQGTDFKYYSRSLKPVMQHKVSHFKEFIPQAFPHGEDLILDAEILLIDTTTGKPLPFGSLGVHKKTAFKEANVCLFVFDCMYYNGKLLIDRPVQERRQILEKNMKEIQNRIMFSEMKKIETSKELEAMITEVFQQGLEGLVLKDVMSTYEPGKRHWLKVKKDYLFGGAMADSVDMVVLGAWYGTGAKGGMMSSFLMGVRDTASNKWCTVTKVHGGHDDATLQSLQTQLDVVKISKDEALRPDWLDATKSMVPDFVARDPTRMPVWEVTGAEFTQHNVHTAHGISIRFPRVTKIRGDKDWRTATSLQELDELYKKSKENADFALPDSSNRPSSEEKKCPTPTKTTPVKNVKAREHGTVQQKLSFESPGRKTSSDKHKKHRNGDKSPECDGSDDEVPSKKRKVIEAPENPLPNVFSDVKLWLPVKSKDRESLERYFVAYGGTLLTPSDVGKSTHIIYIDNVCETRAWPKLANHIDIGWLWDSIKLLNLQAVKLYLVGDSVK